MPDWRISVDLRPEGGCSLRIVYPGGDPDGEEFDRPSPPPLYWSSPQSDDIRSTVATRFAAEDADDVVRDLDILKSYGDQLFRWLLTGAGVSGTKDLSIAFRATYAAASEDSGCDVVLDLRRVPNLSAIRWESLYDSVQELFLATDTRSNIVRRVPPRASKEPLPPVEPPVRVLVVTASPVFDPETGGRVTTLDSGKEIGHIERQAAEILGPGNRPGASYVVQRLPHADRNTLHEAMMKWRPHVVHFIGHGDFDGREGFICLETEGDRDVLDRVSGKQFRQILLNNRPWLVVLNSCLGGVTPPGIAFGGVAQELVRDGIPFVVAMQAPISDPAAIAFARKFYAALVQGVPVPAAVSHGRNSIAILAAPELAAEFVIPALYISGEERNIRFAPPRAAALASRSAPSAAGGHLWHWSRRYGAAAGVTLGILLLATFVRLDLREPSAPVPDPGPVRPSPSPVPGPVRPSPSPAPAPVPYDPARVDTPASRDRDVARSPTAAGPRQRVSPDPGISPAVGDAFRVIQFLAQMIRTTQEGAHSGDVGPPVGHPCPVGTRAVNSACLPVTEPPPPVIVVPPPPPPVINCPNGTQVTPPAACPPIGPFIVFFDWNRDEITPHAAGILDNAAEQYRQTGGSQVVLAGHADRSGSDQYNVSISQRRSENVRQYLVGRGIPEGTMRTEAFGESRPAVETADGVREPQNRRVEITFGPGSGW